MMNYYALPTLFQIALMLSLFLLLCGNLCILPFVCQRKQLLPKILTLLSAFLSAGMMILFAADVRIKKHSLDASGASRWLCEKPIAAVLVVAAVLAGFLAYVVVREVRLRRATLPSLWRGVRGGGSERKESSAGRGAGWGEEGQTLKLPGCGLRARMLSVLPTSWQQQHGPGRRRRRRVGEREERFARGGVALDRTRAGRHLEVGRGGRRDRAGGDGQDRRLYAVGAEYYGRTKTYSVLTLELNDTVITVRFFCDGTALYCRLSGCFIFIFYAFFSVGFFGRRSLGSAILCFFISYFRHLFILFILITFYL